MAKSQTVKAREGEILDQNFITPGRFRELDGFRGLAAITVVIYHLGVPATQNYPRTAPSPYDIPLGELGVQLFFIISGFVILLSAIKSGSALKFAVSRFSRIYPTYWFALAVSALVYFIYGNPGRHITIPQTLINTTMLQRFLRVDNVDQVYWTLAVELQFYVMVALYLIIRKGKIYRGELTTILLTWSVIGTALCLLFHPEASLGGAPKMIVWAAVAEHSSLFSLGMMFFMYSHDRKFTWHIPYFAILASLNAALMHNLAHGIGVALIGLVFFIVVYLKNVPVLAKGPLNFLGRISYPLYLGHAMVGYMLVDLFYPVAGPWGARIIALVLVVCFAYLVHISIETKVSASFRSFLTRKLTKA